jgi:transcriptional regulator with XRE-family HTH domain
MKKQQPLPPQQLFTLGDRLKEARRFRKLSQERLGKMMGISQSAVGQCERGITKELTPSNLLRAADALDVNPIWLVNGKGSMLDRNPNTDSLAIRIQELNEGQRAAVMAVVESLLASR